MDAAQIMLRVTDASKTIVGATVHRASKGLAAQIGTAHGLYVTEAHGATLPDSVRYYPIPSDICIHISDKTSANRPAKLPPHMPDHP